MKQTLQIVLFVALVTLVGCGGDPRAKVSGKVTYKDKPLPGGTVVLDVDVKPWKGVHGDKTLAALVSEHGTLPPTPEQTTWSGGTQYVFAHARIRFDRRLVGHKRVHFGLVCPMR